MFPPLLRKFALCLMARLFRNYISSREGGGTDHAWRETDAGVSGSYNGSTFVKTVLDNMSS